MVGQHRPQRKFTAQPWTQEEAMTEPAEQVLVCHWTTTTTNVFPQTIGMRRYVDRIALIQLQTPWMCGELFRFDDTITTPEMGIRT